MSWHLLFFPGDVAEDHYSTVSRDTDPPVHPFKARASPWYDLRQRRTGKPQETALEAHSPVPKAALTIKMASFEPNPVKETENAEIHPEITPEQAHHLASLEANAAATSEADIAAVRAITTEREATEANPDLRPVPYALNHYSNRDLRRPIGP